MLLLTCRSRAGFASAFAEGTARGARQGLPVQLLTRPEMLSSALRLLTWQIRAELLSSASAAAHLAEQGGVAQPCLGSCWCTLAAAQAGDLPACMSQG